MSERYKAVNLQKMVSPEFETIDPYLWRFFNEPTEHFPNRFVTGSNDTTLFSDTVTIRNQRKQILKKIILTRLYQYPTTREIVTPYLTIYKEYFANGNIHIKGLDSWLGCEIGNQYFFDERGQLIKVNQTDVGYDFNFEDVLNFCKKAKILLENNRHCRIQKRVFEGLNVWHITAIYPKYYEKNKYVTIILDGKTGNIEKITPQSPVFKE